MTTEIELIARHHRTERRREVARMRRARAHRGERTERLVEAPPRR